MLVRVAAIIFLFQIQLGLPKSKSILDILHGRYGQSTIKRVQKFEALDYHLHETELGLKILLWCRDSNVTPNFLNFHVCSHSLKTSLSYKQCQLKLLQVEIRHKKSDIIVLNKEFKTSHSSFEHKISFLDCAHVCVLFPRSNNRILASKGATQKKVKGVVTDMRYFAKSKFSNSLVHKKNFSLI